jgi:protein gp37
VRVSEGCQLCYAESFSSFMGFEIWGPTAPRRFFGEKHWGDPLRWNRKAEAAGTRERVFCASMADVLEVLPNGHPDTARMSIDRARLWELIGKTPWLDWLLLTKRPQNARMLMPQGWFDPGGWPENAWFGVTAENEIRAKERLPILRDIPAPVRFVSYEPAIEEVYWVPWLHADTRRGERRAFDWLIFGGESGRGARPCT